MKGRRDLSYKIDTGYRKSKFIFNTREEAEKFAAEVFRKTKVAPSLEYSTSTANYAYTDDRKLIRIVM